MQNSDGVPVNPSEIEDRATQRIVAKRKGSERGWIELEEPEGVVINGGRSFVGYEVYGSDGRSR